MSGLDYIAEERWRQLVFEGWTAEHDNQWTAGELARAAAAYALVHSAPALPRAATDLRLAHDIWPFRDEMFQPRTPRENLIRAGALIAAELDRLDRNEGKA